MYGEDFYRREDRRIGRCRMWEAVKQAYNDKGLLQALGVKKFEDLLVKSSDAFYDAVTEYNLKYKFYTGDIVKFTKNAMCDADYGVVMEKLNDTTYNVLTQNGIIAVIATSMKKTDKPSISASAHEIMNALYPKKEKEDD